MNCHTSALSSHCSLTLVDVPRSTSIPASSEGVPDSLLLSTITLSSTVKVSVLTCVVVPLTVRLPLKITSSLNVLAPPTVCEPDVLTTVLSTATASAATLIPSPCPTANDLLAVISPPPVRPAPAVNETPLWSICSFATNPLRLS